jgi:putative selenate reductase molybdopterin-binding subunit
MILAPEAEGRKITSIEHFNKDPVLRTIQRALIDASCVQCGYCTPAVALAIRELLARSTQPSDAQIADALSGTLCRCTGYKQFFEAVHLASARLSDPGYKAPTGDEFKPDLRHVGKDREKVDAQMLAQGERAFVEDRLPQDVCWLKVLGSPIAHGWTKSIYTAEAEAVPGVVAIVSHLNTPRTLYTSAGQGFPEPSPYDQPMFPRKVRHVGDRVAAVLAESPEIAEEALKKIKVEYEIV